MNPLERELLEESAEELYDHAPAGYISSLLDGTILKVNATLLRWAQYEREALVGNKRFHDLLPPGARIYYETHYAPLLRMQGEIRGVATEIVRSDGSRLPVLLNSVVAGDPTGTHVVRTTVFDASERRAYERELLHARVEAEQRARASLALAHVVEGVMVVGSDGRVQLLNPAAEAILGVTAATAVGRQANATLPGWAAVAGRIVVARGLDEPVQEVVPFQREDGERWLSAAAADAGDAVVYTLRDITAERDLDQLRADIVAVVSHELRTPLAGVYGAAQTLAAREDMLTPDVRRQFLDMMVDQCERLGRILDQMLVTSSLDAGELALHEDTFDAAEAVDGLVASLGAGTRHRVVVDVASGLTLRADLDRLRQVLGNLVDNALKYSDGTVRIAVERRDLSVRFTVADDGQGIPEAERERVFAKFFRLDPAQYRGVGGTGLGLYIARELVGRMGGRIGFVPRERGTTIFVDVPQA